MSARVGVESRINGDAGSLQITAREIQLDSGGFLSAATAAGEQGNIILNADDILLRHGSSITTNAIGSATGGNITIATETLVALENSDIKTVLFENHYKIVCGRHYPHI